MCTQWSRYVYCILITIYTFNFDCLLLELQPGSFQTKEGGRIFFIFFQIGGSTILLCPYFDSLNLWVLFANLMSNAFEI